MPNTLVSPSLIGGRLSIDFVNELGSSSDFSWEELLRFLLVARIISSERSAQLLALPQNDPQSAALLLGKSQRLHASLNEASIPHVFYESPGTDHEWQTWRRDLEDFAPRLFNSR